MEQEAFMDACLHIHEDLLRVERGLHEFITAAAGFEVAEDERIPDNPWRAD